MRNLGWTWNRHGRWLVWQWRDALWLLWSARLLWSALLWSPIGLHRVKIVGIHTKGF